MKSYEDIFHLYIPMVNSLTRNFLSLENSANDSQRSRKQKYIETEQKQVILCENFSHHSSKVSFPW